MEVARPVRRAGWRNPPSKDDRALQSDPYTYIPLSAGFLYLVAIMDWASRHVLSWRLSNTMDTGFCIQALEAALGTGTPEIFNTDSENDAAGCSLMA